MFLVFSLIIIAIFSFLYWVQWKWEKENKMMGIKGPKPIAVLGNLHSFWKFKEDEMFLKLLELYDEFKTDTILIRFAHEKFVLTKDLKILETIANNPKFIKSNEYEYFKIWLGNGLVTSHGERWYKLRKLITPAFHFQMLERFIPIFEEQTDILIEKFRLLSENNDILDVFPMFHAFALDVISESAMGIKLNSQTDSKSEFVLATSEMLATIHHQLSNPLYMINLIWKMTATGKRQQVAIKFLNEFINNIIEKRRAHLLSQSGEDTNSRPVLLDILLQSEMDGKPLTNEDIRGEVNTFMFAGHETTGTTLSFVMYLLAKHPDAQQKLYQELFDCGIYDSSDEKLTMKSLNSSPYLDGVIKESLRLYPIFPGIPKKCVEDFRMGDIFIPANTGIATTFLSNHLDENYFKDAKSFIPERWADEVSVKERNPYVYQPFSAGLRNCIGQKFAMLEMKVAIVKILSKFQIMLATENFAPEIAILFSTKSKNGIQLKLKERN